jgi:BRCA2, helical
VHSTTKVLFIIFNLSLNECYHYLTRPFLNLENNLHFSTILSFRWVKNHYKWIVWKLASYERCYPSIAAGNFLTVFNVLEELKYR